jgi:hypothetical protein
LTEANVPQNILLLETFPARSRQLSLFPDLVNDQVRKLEDRLSALGAWLMWLPDSPDATVGTRLFHAVCDRLHRAEALKSGGTLTAMERTLHRAGKRLRRSA